jgi:proteasome inhibitor subunit 1 (PI31)
MYVGPNHPIFGPRGGPSGAGGVGGIPGTQPRGPWGGDGYLPPMGAPPGARFDPVGPFGGIGGGIGRLPGPGGRGRGTGGPFSGEPDNDEFLPPRSGGPGNFPDDMYM